MPHYELSDLSNFPLLTLTAANDDILETELIMFANAIAGSKGSAFVEKKSEYWKVIYRRYKAKERFLIVKRKVESNQS